MSAEHQIVTPESVLRHHETVPAKEIKDFPFVRTASGEPYSLQANDPSKFYAEPVVVGYIHGGMVHDAFSKSMQKLQHASRNVTHILSESSCNVPLNRNVVMHRFLELPPDQAGWLLFVDSDIRFPPWTVAALLKVGVETGSDIVAAPYKLTNGCSTFGRLEDPLPPRIPAFGALPRVNLGQGFQTQGAFLYDRAYEIHAAGTGCMMVRRALLERMKEAFSELAPWEFCGYDPIILKGKPDYESDDYSLCHRALDLGAKVAGYTGVVLRHYKASGLVFDGLEGVND